MAVIKTMRRQRAVLWSRSTNPDRYGRFTYETPVEIRCRWEDVSEEFRTATGQTIMSKSLVYVDRVIKVGDMLRRGEIDSDEPSDPTDESLSGVTSEVKRFDQLPDFKAKLTLYTAYL